jgi:hypothetical protein
MKTQTDQVFEHLLHKGSITPQEALREYAVMRLAARVQELREAGHQIQTVMVSRRRKGQMVRYAEYRYHAQRSAA